MAATLPRLAKISLPPLVLWMAWGSRLFKSRAPRVASLERLAGEELESNRATAAGYATFSLGSLYDTVKNGVTFDLANILTSTTPFGTLMSLDGIHPSAAGQAVLASAAKAAIIQKYGTITH